MTPRGKAVSAKKKASRKDVPPVALREVLTRHIDRAIERELWGRSAGRCEFAGCNKALWKVAASRPARPRGLKPQA